MELREMKSIPQTLKNVLKPHIPNEILTIKAIDTYENLVFHILTEKQNYFLKIFTNPNKKESLFHYNQCISFSNCLKHSDIPCPKIIFKTSEISLNEKKYPAILMESIQGNNLKTLLHEQKPSLYERPKMLYKIYENFGYLVGKLHTIEIDSTNNNFSFYSKKKSNPTNFINQIKKRFAKIQIAQIEPLKSQILSYFKSELEQDYFNNLPFCLTHGDLNKKNIFFQNTELTGIIDFDDAGIGYAEEELMRIELDHFSNYPKLHSHFLNAYQSIKSIHKGYSERKPFFFIARQLVGLMCISNFGNLYSNSIVEDIMQIKEDITNIIS